MELLHTRPEQTLGGKGSIGLPARVWVGACVQVRGPCKHRGHVRDQGRRSEETAWVGGRVQGSLAISEPSAPARAPLWMGQEDLRAGNRPQWRGRRPAQLGPSAASPWTPAGWTSTAPGTSVLLDMHVRAPPPHCKGRGDRMAQPRL